MRHACHANIHRPGVLPYNSFKLLVILVKVYLSVFYAHCYAIHLSTKCHLSGDKLASIFFLYTAYPPLLPVVPKYLFHNMVCFKKEHVYVVSALRGN